MKNIVIGGIVLIAAFGMLIWSSDTAEMPIVYYNNTEIACLPNGHQSVETHIHPLLVITVDGEQEVVPANIGVTNVCMSEIHTHDESGSIHVETFDGERLAEMTLSDFFTVWDREVEREGYELEVLQDGEVKSSVENVAMIDHSMIELRYTTITEE